MLESRNKSLDENAFIDQVELFEDNENEDDPIILAPDIPSDVI